MLCAMVGANQASEEEECLLAEHAESCPKCQQAVQHYRQIVRQIHVEDLDSVNQHEVPQTEEEAEERAKAKNRLSREVHGALQPPLAGEMFGVLPQRVKSGTASGGGVPLWASWAVAASLLIAVGVNSAQYWESRRHAGATEIRAAGLEKELDGLREEMANERARRLQVVQQQQPPATTRSDETEKLRSENEALRQSLASSEAARQQEARDFISMRDRERLLQSSLEVFQASKSTLETENAELSAKISKLTDDLKKSHEELTGLTARNEAGSQDALSKVKYVVDRQQKLLATDHDIRDILGSRSLHIIDVYDVSGQGELEHPFGRIFYTEGKSLIFYAFDLDQQRGLKHGAVFQAWGQKGEGMERPRSLGTFYMDDSMQNRWVLKVADNKALSRIDYVYVTDSSHKESVKPKGKPLLSAFLNGPANHP
jgi:hypothetical protein